MSVDSETCGYSSQICRVWDGRRVQRHCCVVRDLASAIDLGRKKLNMGQTEHLQLCLEEDGTVIDSDESFFHYLARGYTTFLLLRKEETWMPRTWITYGSRSMPDAYGTPLENYVEVLDRSTQSGKDGAEKQVKQKFGILLKNASYRLRKTWMRFSGRDLANLFTADDEVMQKHFPDAPLVYFTEIRHLVNQKWSEYVKAVQAAMVEAKEGKNRGERVPYYFAYEKAWNKGTTPEPLDDKIRPPYLSPYFSPFVSIRDSDACTWKLQMKETCTPSDSRMVANMMRTTLHRSSRISFASFFVEAREVLGLSKEKDVRLVLEEDGSEVQDDAAFLAGRTFLLLKKGECWRCREWIDFDSGTYPLYTDFKTIKVPYTGDYFQVKDKLVRLVYGHLIHERIYRTAYPWFFLDRNMLDNVLLSCFHVWSSYLEQYEDDCWEIGKLVEWKGLVAYDAEWNADSREVDPSYWLTSSGASDDELEDVLNTSQQSSEIINSASDGMMFDQQMVDEGEGWKAFAPSNAGDLFWVTAYAGINGMKLRDADDDSDEEE